MTDPSIHAMSVLVHVVDDLPRRMVSEALQPLCARIDAIGAADAALRRLDSEHFDVVVLDLSARHGTELLSVAKSLQPNAHFITVSGPGAVDVAVEAMRLGASDNLAMPFGEAEIVSAFERARSNGQGPDATERLSARTASGARTRMIGRSPAMERLFDLIDRVAPLRATVLVAGETGTGKELVAQAIHAQSARARRPFVPVNCSALPETLLEAELFGHVKGSFTGATSSRRGLIEEAAGGTLFLDEISTVSSQIQVKLLRVLEERTIYRVGSSQPTPVDFRLVAATNVDLARCVADGSFREDLYYRLNVFPIRVPPLRERAADIPLLAQHFLQQFAQENELPAPRLSAPTLQRMMDYLWPGNVRELENFIDRAVILFADSGEIRFLRPSTVGSPSADGLVQRASDEDWDLDRLEREYMMLVFEKTGGHHGQTADILGIDRRTLYRKLRAIGANRRRSGATVGTVYAGQGLSGEHSRSNGGTP